jgi:hypothetical protein
MTRVRPPSLLSVTAILLLAVPVALPAQARPVSRRDASAAVPANMLPPAGKCRIWMRGVPASQQPAATDCATALRQKPPNGMIVYGPAAKEPGGGRFDLTVGDSSTARAARPGARPAAADSAAERSKRAAPVRRDSAASTRKPDAARRPPADSRKKPE